jgi:hypothetical protein
MPEPTTVQTVPFAVTSWEGKDHIPGDEDCAACYGGAAPYPCHEPGCDGLVHEAFEDESYDDVYCKYLCDKCGSTDRPEEVY